jgi:hypothetical protein
MCEVKKYSAYLLDEFLSSVIKGRGIVFFFLRILLFCPIYGLDMGIWLILPLSWRRVLETDKGFVDIVGHR